MLESKSSTKLRAISCQDILSAYERNEQLLLLALEQQHTLAGQAETLSLRIFLWRCFS
jgi:hypothetical protein